MAADNEEGSIISPYRYQSIFSSRLFFKYFYYQPGVVLRSSFGSYSMAAHSWRHLLDRSDWVEYGTDKVSLFRRQHFSALLPQNLTFTES